MIDTAIQKGIARGMEEGLVKGMEEGIAKGEWMKAQTIAGNLKNAGLSIAEIAKVTGLSEDEINSL